MSSVLEFGTEDVLFQQPHEGTGLFIIADSEGENTIFIREDPTAPFGNDVVLGGDADDNIFTGEGDDTIIGGDGLDLLSGQGGNDIIRGGEGNDIIDGGTGEDMLIGGEGNDTIDGGTGGDTLVGGEGEDIFKFQLADFQDGEIDIIQDYEQGVDSFDFASGIDPDLITQEGNLIKYDGETVIEVQGDEPDLEIF